MLTQSILGFINNFRLYQHVNQRIRQQKQHIQLGIIFKLNIAGRVVLLKHVLHLTMLPISRSILKLNQMEMSGTVPKYFFSNYVPWSVAHSLWAIEVVGHSLDMKRMLTCGDQIHSEPFYCWGWSVPQASVDSDLLHKITLRVAHAAKVSDKGNLIFSLIILIILHRFPIMKLFQCLNTLNKKSGRGIKGINDS